MMNNQKPAPRNQAHSKSHAHPNVELSKMSYTAYENNASDQRNPSLKKEEVVLTDREILAQNLNPEKVSNLIANGAVVRLRRDIRDDIPLIILFALIVAGILWVTFIFPPSPSLFAAQIIIPLFFLAILVHRQFNSKYYIESDGVIVVKGLLFITMSRLKCNYDKIKVVEVYKNILQRLLMVGDIRVSTALVDHPELSLDGVANPYFYVAVIKIRTEETVASLTPTAGQEQDDGISIGSTQQQAENS